MEISHIIAASKGWWDGGEKDFSQVIALIHSELDEGYDYLVESLVSNTEIKDDHLPDQPGFIVELADTAIRIFDFLGYYVDQIDPRIQDVYAGEGKLTNKPEPLKIKNLIDRFKIEKFTQDNAFVFLGRIHSLLSKALEHNRKDGALNHQFLIRAMIYLFVFSNSTFGEGVLESVIIQKLNYNLHRQPKHGKKY
jgi:hypothetical protein